MHTASEQKEHHDTYSNVCVFVLLTVSTTSSPQLQKQTNIYPTLAVRATLGSSEGCVFVRTARREQRDCAVQQQSRYWTSCSHWDRHNTWWVNSTQSHRPPSVGFDTLTPAVGTQTKKHRRLQRVDATRRIFTFHSRDYVEKSTRHAVCHAFVAASCNHFMQILLWITVSASAFTDDSCIKLNKNIEHTESAARWQRPFIHEVQTGKKFVWGWILYARAFREHQ